MVPLDRLLLYSYALSIVTMTLSTAVWPQFATQVFQGGAGSLRRIRSYANKYETTFASLRQLGSCYSDVHVRTVYRETRWVIYNILVMKLCADTKSNNLLS